jgi:hypothetical protein
MTAASKPIRYELTIKDGTIYSLIYRTEGKPIVIKACQLINGTSLPKSRQWLAKMAERWVCRSSTRRLSGRNPIQEALSASWDAVQA